MLRDALSCATGFFAFCCEMRCVLLNGLLSFVTRFVTFSIFSFNLFISDLNVWIAPSFISTKLIMMIIKVIMMMMIIIFSQISYL